MLNAETADTDDKDTMGKLYDEDGESVSAGLLINDAAGPSKPAAPRYPPIVFVYVVIAACANILFGYENSNIASAKNAFRSSSTGAGTTDAQLGFLVGALALGATFVCPFAGFLQSGLGRRRTLLLCCVAYMGAALVSTMANGFLMLAAGRLLTGLTIGVFSSTVPMYVAELSPAALRGSLVTVNQVCICTGILLGYAAGAALGNQWRWQFAAGIPLAALLFFAFILVTPYSPRWLMTKGREEEARAVLMTIRGGDEAAVEAELDGIRDAVAQVAAVTSLKDQLLQRHVLWGVTIGVMGAIMQQFCGVNAVNGFAPDIFKSAGSNNPQLESVAIGVSKLVFVVVALLLMDRAGRKPLLLVGCAGMAACLIALALTFQLKLPGWTAVASLVLYMSFFEVSLGPILWLLLSELYPLPVKGVAMSIGSTVTWGMTYVVTQAFTPLCNALTEAGAFYLFAGMCVASFVWIKVYVFETKGRTLEEIELLLKGAKPGPDGTLHLPAQSKVKELEA